MDQGRAQFFITSTTPEPLHDIVQPAFPASEGCKRAGKTSPGMVASIALQQDLVLAKMVTRLIDGKRLHLVAVGTV
jgi:hypothetical protein